MENWKDVVGFPGYKVSDLGQVRGKFGVILKPRLVNGYQKVHLFKKKQFNFSVHQLVAAAFIGPRPVGLEVDHRNDIRTDNRANNLHYLTKNENGRKKPKREGCASPYLGVSKNGNRWQARVRVEKDVNIGTFATQEEAARARDKFYRERGMLVIFNFA